MKITVINGTNRVGNNSMKVSEKLVQILKKNHTSHLVDVSLFNNIFTGSFVTLENATPKQKKCLKNIISSDLLFFVVPTYTHGIPAALKNFFDMVAIEDLYSDKTIGIISSNSRGEDGGAKQTAEILQGISQALEKMAFVVPKIEIVDLENVNEEQLERFINYCLEFKQ